MGNQNSSKPCRHERKTSFQVASQGVQHEYCPECGWHNYKGTEYTREEWHEKYIKDRGRMFHSVRDIIDSHGKIIPDQFIIENDFLTPRGQPVHEETLQIEKLCIATTITIKDFAAVVIDHNYLTYPKEIISGIEIFLNESFKEIEKKISTKEYIISDLNK